MRTSSLFLMLSSLIVASCTCASDSGPPTPKAAAAKAQSKARGDRAKRPEPVLPENPIIKSVRYAWAITPVAETDLASLQTEVIEALTAAKGEAPTVPEEMPKKWKCRIGTFYPVTHADGADATVRTYERQSTIDCGDDAEDTEKWEFTLRFNEVERSNSRDAPGTAPFHMLSRSEVTTSAGAASSFHRSFKVDTRGGKAKSGPFPHDAAWIAEQVGDDFTFAEDTHQVRSDRWAIAQAQLDGERIVVEYEQWSCMSGGAPIGAELVVRTIRKAADHTPQNQLDVEVGEGTAKLPEGMAEAVGSRLSETRLNAALAATCGG